MPLLTRISAGGGWCHLYPYRLVCITAASPWQPYSTSCAKTFCTLLIGNVYNYIYLVKVLPHPLGGILHCAGPVGHIKA